MKTCQRNLLFTKNYEEKFMTLLKCAVSATNGGDCCRRWAASLLSSNITNGLSVKRTGDKEILKIVLNEMKELKTFMLSDTLKTNGAQSYQKNYLKLFSKLFLGRIFVSWSIGLLVCLKMVKRRYMFSKNWKRRDRHFFCMDLGGISILTDFLKNK